MTPTTQALLKEAFHITTSEEADHAIKIADQAFESLQLLTNEDRSHFLKAIIVEFQNLGNSIIERALMETKLGKEQLIKERKRTIQRIENLIKELEEEKNKAQTQVQSEDIWGMQTPPGPIVILAKSEFPILFSSSVSDVFSAIALGCPVLVNGHEKHTGTNGLFAIAIKFAAKKTQMPDGVFTYLNGKGTELNEVLLNHSMTKAIAFTGSFQEGNNIYEKLANRKTSIPAFYSISS